MMIADSPLVSIVIPCYNHQKYVESCIFSVINQDYKNIELIIIDDGSTDNSVLKIEKSIEKCRQRFHRFEFRSRGNKGLCHTLNEAIEWCEGEYFSVIASDDEMLPHKTTVQVQYLSENQNCIAVFGGVHVIDANGHIIRSSCFDTIRSYCFKSIFLMAHDLPAATQMLRLEKLRATGGYPNDLYIEDWYMWLALADSGGSLDKLNKIVCRYRRHEANMSSKLNSMERARFDIIERYRHNELYQRAKANILIMAAIDLQVFNKNKALLKFMSGIRVSFFDLFQFKCFKFIIKLLLPVVFLRYYFERR